MSAGKRYYWLKLKDDFFTSKRIKKLRKLAGGDTFVIIYLKIQLKAIKTDGILTWTGLEDNFASELALELDEDEDNVKFTIAYLMKCGLAESSDNIHYLFPYAIENVGSEGSSAQRMRDLRKRINEEHRALPSPGNITMCAQCDGEKEIESELELEPEKREKNSFNDDSNDDDRSEAVIDEFAKRTGLIIEGYELFRKCDDKTRKKVAKTTKNLFEKAVGTKPTEMDEAKVFSWTTDLTYPDRDGFRISDDRIFILTCAFYKAADAGHRGQWNYIDAIMDDMNLKGIDTKDKAVEYFHTRKGGSVWQN